MRYYFSKIKVRTYGKISRIISLLEKGRPLGEHSYWACVGREAQSGIAISKDNYHYNVFSRSDIREVRDFGYSILEFNKFFSLPEIFFRRIVYFKLADRK